MSQCHPHPLQSARPFDGKGVVLKARELLWIGFALANLLQVGCGQVQVSESPPMPIPMETPATGRPEHDLAILGAEVDPPLDGANRLMGGAVSFQLLVAVENRGSQPERDVIVEAWLKAPSGREEVVILNGKTIVPYLAPGEVRVAKVSASGAIPVLSSYTIAVTVRPVRFETNVGNNTNQYQVFVLLPSF